MNNNFRFTLNRISFDENYNPSESTRITTNFANLARGEKRQDNLRNALTMIDNRFNALAHWREDGHDWLVVADGKADEVVVYDAADGRPLQRLRVKGGLQDRDALVQRDDHLFVVGQNGTLEELSLPQLEIAAADSR